jgi:hypothetical protein
VVTAVRSAGREFSPEVTLAKEVGEETLNATGRQAQSDQLKDMAAKVTTKATMTIQNATAELSQAGPRSQDLRQNPKLRDHRPGLVTISVAATTMGTLVRLSPNHTLLFRLQTILQKEPAGQLHGRLELIPEMLLDFGPAIP